MNTFYTGYNEAFEESSQYYPDFGFDKFTKWAEEAKAKAEIKEEEEEEGENIDNKDSTTTTKPPKE